MLFMQRRGLSLPQQAQTCTQLLVPNPNLQRNLGGGEKNTKHINQGLVYFVAFLVTFSGEQQETLKSERWYRLYEQR